MELSLTQEQRFVLSWQLKQSMQLLQMSAAELETYIVELSNENPLISIGPPAESWERRTAAATFRKPRSSEKAGASAEPEHLSPQQDCESLSQSVLEQIAALRVPKLLRRELEWLAGELDERGYLPADCGDLNVFCGSIERYENAVFALQSLEPAGVGARSLSECLKIQLRRKGVEDDLPYIICGRYLERIAKGQLNHIAKSLGVPVQRVAEAKSLITALEPRPSNGYSGGEIIPYVMPDVEVVPKEGGFEVIPADRYMPAYGIDAFYARMAQSEGLSVEEREYFKARLTQASWVISCVSRRRDMLLQCACEVAQRQAAFFSDGRSPLEPLTMSEVAKTLGVYPSTVSRAVRGKYLSCKWGLYPLSHFFCKEISGNEGATGGELLTAIKKIIASEDAAHPVSDKDISGLLRGYGFNVSRRTVAKYREEAAVPPASGRRSY